MGDANDTIGTKKIVLSICDEKSRQKALKWTAVIEDFNRNKLSLSNFILRLFDQKARAFTTKNT